MGRGRLAFNFKDVIAIFSTFIQDMFIQKCVIVLVMSFIQSFICFSWDVFAQENTFIVGVENIDYYPHYAYKDKQYSGFARELLDAFAKQHGYQFEYKPLPINRLFSSFLEKLTVDFKYPDNPYWSAEMREGKMVTYSEAVVSYLEGVMVRPERKGMGLDTFKKLGTVLGFTAWDYLDEIKAETIQLFESPTTSGILEMAILKRIDGVYIERDVARYTLEAVLQHPEALVFDPNLPHTKSSFFLASIRYPEVITEFNEFLTAQHDLVRELKQKYKLETE